jgi:hypothetical protein
MLYSWYDTWTDNGWIQFNTNYTGAYTTNGQPTLIMTNNRLFMGQTPSTGGTSSMVSIGDTPANTGSTALQVLEPLNAVSGTTVSQAFYGELLDANSSNSSSFSLGGGLFLGRWTGTTNAVSGSSAISGYLTGLAIQDNYTAAPANGDSTHKNLVPALEGLDVLADVSGTYGTITRATQLYIHSPTSPGTGTTISHWDGLQIDDQNPGSASYGTSGNESIRINAQNGTKSGSSAAQTGNLFFWDGSYDRGHIEANGAATGNAYNGTHIWWNASDGYMREKVGNGGPSSDNDGNQVALRSNITTAGHVAWGDGSTTTTGTAACSAINETCVSAATLANLTASGSWVSCSTTINTGVFLARCD